MNSVRITYFGMDGEGRTLTEAKKDAGAKIEKALAGTYTPRIVAWRGTSIMLYREPTGWHTCIIFNGNGLKEGQVFGTQYGSYESALRSAQLHLAQLEWTAEDGESIPPILGCRDSVAEYRSWVQFQLRYQEGKARGLNDYDAHSYAGRNPARADLWAEAV